VIEERAPGTRCGSEEGKDKNREKTGKMKILDLCPPGDVPTKRRRGKGGVKLSPPASEKIWEGKRGGTTETWMWRTKKIEVGGTRAVRMKEKTLENPRGGLVPDWPASEQE